jgi:S1-C subfamily serine protease
MPLDIRILTGARKGQSERFDKPTVVVGRASQTDLRFDAQKDLDVSGLHAEIRGTGSGGYELHDSGSTNGTFVNGVKIQGSVGLKPGDHVKFGTDGPEVEVQFRMTAAAKVAGSTEERVAIAVRHQTAGLRRMLIAGFGLIVVGLAAAYWIGQRAASQQIARVTQQLQESEARIRAIQVGIPGDTALANELQRRMTSLRTRLGAASRDAERDRISAEIGVIQGELAALTRLDLGSINSRNAPAVAILVSMIGGTSFAGTAFAITRQGVLLTNRHNVRSTNGRDTTTKMVVKFRDSNKWLPARLVRISEDSDADLALIQMDDPGPYPTIAGFHAGYDDALDGASVALIGFPFGYETAQEGEGTDFIAKTTLNGGTVSKRTSSVLQIDSYAGHGSSGSPVLGAHGAVVGVVWGGLAEAGGRIVYAVPPDKVAAFLGPGYKSLIKD